MYRELLDHAAPTRRPATPSNPIGSCFYRDEHGDHGTLRDLARTWILHAQTWLGVAYDKGQLGLVSVQVHCLLLLARQVNGLGGDLTWVSAGALTRTAMSMGLHRDPNVFPNVTPFFAEMRRRLWLTVLELDVQASLDSGTPPLM